MALLPPTPLVPMTTGSLPEGLSVTTATPSSLLSDGSSTSTGLQTVLICLAVLVIGGLLIAVVMGLKMRARHKKKKLWARYQRDLKEIGLPMCQKEGDDPDKTHAAPRPRSEQSNPWSEPEDDGDDAPAPGDLEAGPTETSHFSDSSDDDDKLRRVARKLTPSMLARRKSGRKSSTTLPAAPQAAVTAGARPPDYATSMAQASLQTARRPSLRVRPDPCPIQRPRQPSQQPIPPLPSISPSNTPPRIARSRAPTPFSSDESRSAHRERQEVDLDELALSGDQGSDG